MIKKSIVILLTAILGVFLAAHSEIEEKVHDMKPSTKTISENGFQATWYFQDDQLVVEMVAPTEGWVALGFNERDDIVGTNLIMGAVVDDQIIIEDQYVVKPGEHPPAEQIGGQSAIMTASGSEQNGQTTISFSLPQKAVDQYHYDLSPQREIFLILAYSREDDFEHHSLMRKHVKIEL